MVTLTLTKDQLELIIEWGVCTKNEWSGQWGDKPGEIELATRLGKMLEDWPNAK